MPLVIANRDPHPEPIPLGFPVWRTCLREVAFADDASDSLVVGGQRFIEGDAYRVLLEVLCGLRSPMIGETQVMGQFKAFLGSLDRRHGWLHRIGQRLLADAREIRTQHLQGLGSRSYGSAIRRHLTDVDHAVLVGTGKLAAEVLPFLAGAATHVDHWGRSVDGAGRSADGAIEACDAVLYRTLDHLDRAPVSLSPTVIVIAAPVASTLVAQLAMRYPRARRVIDLRADTGGAPLDLSAPVISLQALFDSMQESQASAAPQVQAARIDIAARSRQYELREEPRPFGWEDVCA